MLKLTRLPLGFALSLAFLAGCSGQAGPQGPAGANGSTGQPGLPGAAGCDGRPGSAPPTLGVTLAVSSPASGGFFTPGERPVLTARITDGCARVVPAAALGALELYLAGPRGATLTRTASKLLNAVTNRAAPDRQHHFVNLKAPSHADPSQANLATRPDGTLAYTLAAVSDEPAGTYTAGLSVRSTDGAVQELALVDLQVGTATAESYASGAPASASCRSCHLGASSGQVNLQHAFASPIAPAGLPGLDQAPVASCQLCHNLDGYSLNPTVRKVHGLHRGVNQSAPGAAHGEYGLGADATLLDFSSVIFPSMPGADRDCAACHVDDRWATRPSRLACGTCHDNLFFDTGTLIFGPPVGGACTADPDCASFGAFATCDVVVGSCQRATHPAQPDDARCATCHTADLSGTSPITASHEIYQRTRSRGLAISQVTVGGATGPGGTFQLGDQPVLSFRLADRGGVVVSDLLANAALAFTAAAAGPVEARQRVYAPISSKAAATFDTSSGIYTLTFPSWPANAQPPANVTDPSWPVRYNPPGSYTVYLYVTETLTASGQTFRDAASAVMEVKFGVDAPTRPRQVVTTAACNGCHVQVQAHGGTRRVAEACGVCHTAGAVDRGIGSTAAPCTSDAQCPGFAAGWEACIIPPGGSAKACTVTVDPTPNATVAFGPMTHSIHFARLLGGYAERNDLVGTGRYWLVVGGNRPTDLSQGLLSQDPRNCTACHADAGNGCSSDLQCGFGQACRAARCENVAWLEPSSPACLSCHDTAAATGHAALNTWTAPEGPVETCQVCHGPGAAYAADLVHRLGPGVLPLSRTPLP
jgi:hypothetical protein